MKSQEWPSVAPDCLVVGRKPVAKIALGTAARGKKVEAQLGGSLPADPREQNTARSGYLLQ